MGRELRRKEAKKYGKNVKEAEELKKESEGLKPKSFLVILGVLVLFFVLLYLITSLFITKDFSLFNNKDNEEESTSISNKILAVDTLKQEEDEYFVYYYDTTDEDSEVSSSVNRLGSKIYRVDLHDDFNSNYVGEVSGVVDDIEDLKVENPTIVKVSGGRIIEFYSGSEQIKNLNS